MKIFKKREMAEQIKLKVNRIIHVGSEEEMNEVLECLNEEGIKFYKHESEDNVTYFKGKGFFKIYHDAKKEVFLLIIDHDGKEILFGHPEKTNYKTAAAALAEFRLPTEVRFIVDKNTQALEAFEVFKTVIMILKNDVTGEVIEMHSIREFKKFFEEDLKSTDFYIDNDDKLELDPENGVDFYLDILGL